MTSHNRKLTILSESVHFLHLITWYKHGLIGTKQTLHITQGHIGIKKRIDMHTYRTIKKKHTHTHTHTRTRTHHK